LYISVALGAPDTCLKFKNLAIEEYRNAIFRLESRLPASGGNDRTSEFLADGPKSARFDYSAYWLKLPKPQTAKPDASCDARLTYIHLSFDFLGSSAARIDS
jgi:hypothetical protein